MMESGDYVDPRIQGRPRLNKPPLIYWLQSASARALTHNAAWMRDQAAPRIGPTASRAKLYAGEMVNRVVYKAVQIHGSQGYSRESDVERMYRDARVITIYEGTSEIQRLIIARDLLRASGEASPRNSLGVDTTQRVSG